MIEKIVLDFLCEKLDVDVFMEEPEKPTKSYVLIEKTGSSEQDFLSSATLAIQSYGASLYDAAKLNKHVKQAMAELICLSQICRCKLNSDYNFTDTTTKRYRYQAVFDIIFYDE